MKVLMQKNGKSDDDLDEERHFEKGITMLMGATKKELDKVLSYEFVGHKKTEVAEVDTSQVNMNFDYSYHSYYDELY